MTIKNDLAGQIHSRAKDASYLDARIAGNQKNQKTDLNQWIFDHLRVDPASSVLELCAGTGAQSVKFLERLTSGSLTSTDASGPALESIKEKAAAQKAADRLSVVQSDMDELPAKLTGKKFNLIFCAYGLYYSKKADALLDGLLKTLRPDGRITIVGPFGPNNGALFSLLGKAGVNLPEYVTWTSRDFMPHLVLPWAGTHFTQCVLYTLQNEVVWKEADALMTYWKNSTFFDAPREAAVQKLLDEHFAREKAFIDHKWVLYAEMRGMR